MIQTIKVPLMANVTRQILMNNPSAGVILAIEFNPVLIYRDSFTDISIEKFNESNTKIRVLIASGMHFQGHMFNDTNGNFNRFMLTIENHGKIRNNNLICRMATFYFLWCSQE